MLLKTRTDANESLTILEEKNQYYLFKCPQILLFYNDFIVIYETNEKSIVLNCTVTLTEEITVKSGDHCKTIQETYKKRNSNIKLQVFFSTIPSHPIFRNHRQLSYLVSEQHDSFSNTLSY